MSGGDPRAVLYYNLPASVDCEFCRIMDGLSNQDWTRFGESEPELWLRAKGQQLGVGGTVESTVNWVFHQNKLERVYSV